SSRRPGCSRRAAVWSAWRSTSTSCAPARRSTSACSDAVRASARRTSTTVVAVVGDGARACVERLGRGANVATLVPEVDDAPLDRAVTAWSEARRVHTPYFVHDADPLDATANAWVRRFDEEGPIGELEVIVSDTLARWRAGSVELPDYYLVLDAERWGPTRRHWYLGVL